VSIQVPPDAGGKKVRTDTIGGTPTGDEIQLVKIDLGGAGASSPASGALPVSIPGVVPLPTGAATEATLAAIKAKTDNLDVALSTRSAIASTQPVNPVGETAGVGVGAAADVAAVGNGSVIGILKQLRVLLAAGLSSAGLVAGRMTIDIGSWIGSVAATIGQKLMASSIPVAIASDQSALPIVGTIADNSTVGAAKLPTLPAVASSGASIFTEGSSVPLSVDLSGNLRITEADTLVTGTISGTTSVNLDLNNDSVAGLNITGAWTANLVFEGTVSDLAAYVPIPAFVPNSSNVATGTSANGTWLIACAGFRRIRVRCSLYNSGTVTVNWRSCPAAVEIQQIGQQPMSYSKPVVIASDQTPVLVSLPVTLPLPTGASTESTLAAILVQMQNQSRYLSTLQELAFRQLIEMHTANLRDGLESGILQ